MKFRIILISFTILFFVGCDPCPEEELEQIQLNFARKHQAFHDKNGYDFTQPCAMCGSAIHVPVKKEDHAYGVATGVMVGMMAANMNKGYK